MKPPKLPRNCDIQLVGYEEIENWGFVEKKIQEELNFQHFIGQEIDLLTQDIL